MIRLRSDHDVDLVDFMGGDDRTCLSAWVSFGNDKDERLVDRDRVKGLINFLYRNGHMTPFESSVFTFRVTTPIFVAREIFRHRSASYNEWSARYSKIEPEFYVPDRTRPLVQEGKAGDYTFVPGSYGQHRMVEGDFGRIYDEIYRSYERMLEAGVAKEVARDILPVGVYTQFYVTMNARNLMHFLKLRTSDDALYEIREVAYKMEEVFADKMPITHSAWAGSL